MSERLIKVLIVDDESIVRNGLKKIINWEKIGCTICGEASNGKEALEKIRRICQENPVAGTEVSFKLRGIRPPMMQSDASRQLFNLAKEKAAFHGLLLDGRIHGGGSDGSFAADEGIPVLDGMGAEGDGAHTPDEYVVKTTLMARLKMNIDIIDAVMTSAVI